MKKFAFLPFIAALLSFAVASIAADASKTYLAKCAMCHGKTAEGGIMAPNLRISEFVKNADISEVVRIIREGRGSGAKRYPKILGSMPSFKATLSDKEITALVEYLKGL
jgi:mono/diheme cytochrome c family protein